MEFPDDDGLRAVLAHLDVAPEALLGHGGEAWVYALDDATVVRVLHEGGSVAHLTDRIALVRELAQRPGRYALGEVLDIREHAGRTYTIEGRMRGVSVLHALATADGPSRDALIEAHLDAAASLGDLHLSRRPWFGDLVGDEPVRSATWSGYLTDKASDSLGRAGASFDGVDAAQLVSDLPILATHDASFVHLDAFVGNMMTDGTVITAVIDIGWSAVAGDRRVNPVSCAVYLGSQQITPSATPRDLDVARNWLRNAGLDDLYDPLRRWLAAYWAFAVDDRQLHEWCRAVLLSAS